MFAHASHRRRAGRRLPGLACAALAVLAGCATPSVTTTTEPAPFIARSSFETGPSDIAFAMSFARGSTDLATGELLRMQDILRSMELRTGDDIAVRIAITGDVPLDEGRLVSAAAAVAGTPARVRVFGSPVTPLGGNRVDVALVEVVRYGRIRLICPTPAIDSWEVDRLAVDPPVACTNALNIANMAANPRDLVTPRPFGGVDATVSVAAVERYRTDQVKQPAALEPIGD